MKSHQGILEIALAQIFPSSIRFKNARKKVLPIKNPLTQGYLEVDVWYPELKLCFEYQDDYHYQSSWYSPVPLNIVQEKDYIKRNLLHDREETLIGVPFWWDGTSTSLIATIQFYRPDLLQDHPCNCDAVISPNPPLRFWSATELMLASFPHLEVVEINEQNTWWLGEKYDGIRCYWNPVENTLYSRHHLSIEVFPEVAKTFGELAFDAEIWCGRGLFRESQILVYGNLNNKTNWGSLRVVSFDEVEPTTYDKPFEERYFNILAYFSVNHPIVTIAPRLLCTSSTLLTQCLQLVLDEAGEGVILRKPRSLYIPGRSTDLMKIKASRLDQEALVVEVEGDGSLLLQLPTGMNFVVPKEDCVLPTRAVPGDIVTFTQDFAQRGNALAKSAVEDADGAQDNTQAQAQTQGAYIYNPVVYRIRTDLSWEDVLGSSSDQLFHNIPSYQKIPDKSAQSKGHWELSRVRSLLESHALKFGFDPLLAGNWYSFGSEFVQKHKGLTSVLRHVNQSVTHAIASLFPELNLEVQKFKNPVREKNWEETRNRRAFLEEFARSKGGDPLKPAFWYNLKRRDLRSAKGISSILHYYKDVAEVVLHLFPEVQLDSNKLKFPDLPWHTSKEKKIFFDKFAASKGKDPKDASFWYGVTTKQLRKFKPGYKGIRRFHGAKLYICLMRIYPDIRLDPALFASSWRTKAERKSFFDNFAASKGMDPLIPSFWYGVSQNELRNFQHGFAAIKKHHGGKLTTALMQLYPNIGLQEYLFVKAHKWSSKASRRSMLIDFAKSNSFDPLVPSNWYRLSWSDYSTTIKDMIKRNYNRRYVVALMDLFPELGLKPANFDFIPRNHWAEVSNRRELFVSIARDRRFDPLVPSNWYSVPYTSLFNVKRLCAVVDRYYDGNFANALLDVFPNIGLDPSEFNRGKGREQEESRRQYLENVAKNLYFNPLDPEAWVNFITSQQNVSKTNLMLAAQVLTKYPTSAEALLTLFPEMKYKEIPASLYSKFVLLN